MLLYTTRKLPSIIRPACTHRRLTTFNGGPFPKKLAFAFDIDGVLKQGHNVLPEAKRTMKLLTGEDGRLPKPIPFLLITNGGGVLDHERLSFLSSELGVQLTPDQLVQSHTPMRDYAHKYKEKHVLVIGGKGESCRKVAESYGMKNAHIPQDVIAWKPSIWDRTELTKEEEAFVRPQDFSSIQFSAIFVMHDSHDWGRDTTLILDLLNSKNGYLGTRTEGRKNGEEAVELIMSNPDVEWRSDWPIPRLGQGAFRIGLESVYKATTGLDLTYTQYGKPFKATYDFSELSLRRYLASVGRDASVPLHVYMVGDNPASDIAGANAHGWSSILVRTGVFHDTHGEKPAFQPTVIADNVEKGVEWAIGREMGLC
ncbi:HAD hydrolase [Cryptococcus neoformans A2-102-5]|nr:HAD hydrolase [Cryptococcus neoformans var. grubii D17-1]OXG95409.1 HAD hydrolase [Cryptococcus neoformans var. grubii A2-102-5]